MNSKDKPAHSIISNRVDGINRLKVFMGRKNLSFEQVAYDTGSTVSQWQEWTRPSGRFAPTNILIRFCEIYDCSPSWAIFGEGPMFLSVVSERGHIEQTVEDNGAKLDRILRSLGGESGGW